MKTLNTKLIGLIIASFLFMLEASAVPVDLSGWLVDGNGSWTVAGDNNSVFQSQNSPPTVFHNGVDSQGTIIAGTIEVETTSDDDFIGFTLGYTQGDIDGLADTNYILIDWKQGTQSGWEEGLSVSRVTGPIQAGGTDTGSDAWNHVGSVEFLGRANTLGTTGWEDNTSYDFEIVFTSTLITVSINDVLEIELFGMFENGSFGFYNFSQPSVRYAGITGEQVPVPAALPLMLSALGAAGWLGGRRRK